jgi:hypothetical protein
LGHYQAIIDVKRTKEVIVFEFINREVIETYLDKSETDEKIPIKIIEKGGNKPRGGSKTTKKDALKEQLEFEEEKIKLTKKDK